MFYLAKATHVQRRTRVSLVTSIGAIQNQVEGTKDSIKSQISVFGRKKVKA